jgi:hypothetical protein
LRELIVSLSLTLKKNQMKNIFTLLLLTFFSGLFSQSGLNNLDFENLSATPGLGCGTSTNFPSGFRGSTAYTNGAAPLHSMAGGAQSGNNYISITNYNTCGHVDLNPASFSTNPNQPGNGAPFTSKPNSFCGYFRCQGINNTNDSIYVVVYFTNSGNLIGRGRFACGVNTPSWTSFCAPVSFSSALNPDTVRIRFTPSKMLSGSGNGFGSQTIVMDVDNCSFTGITGAEENTNYMQFSVYPNPAADKIHVEVKDKTSEALITIYNVTGRVVKTEKVTAQKTELDLSGLGNGLYFVSISNGGRNTVQRLIVSRN